MYYYAKPANGEAYSPLELRAIWNIEVDIVGLINEHAKAATFHERMAEAGRMTILGGLINDQIAAEMIQRATMAETRGPVTLDDEPEPPAWPCKLNHEEDIAA